MGTSRSFFVESLTSGRRYLSIKSKVSSQIAAIYKTTLLVSRLGETMTVDYSFGFMKMPDGSLV